MSANLDKSLDDLVGNRKKNARRNNRRGSATKPSVGGVKKSAPKGGAKVNAKVIHHATPAATSSKIIVSGLPADVTEVNIKEYFSKSAGPVKKVMLTYNQNGTSRGNAQIIFSKPNVASKAAKELNGILVDGRPIKIEVVYDASHAPAVPAPRSLTERVAQKAQPKPATAAKPATNTRTRGPRGERATRGRQAKNGGRNSGRGKPKTVEELDAEMVDYYADNNNQSNAAAAAAPQANVDEDLGMGEIS